MVPSCLARNCWRRQLISQVTVSEPTCHAMTGDCPKVRGPEEVTPTPARQSLHCRRQAQNTAVDTALFKAGASEKEGWRRKPQPRVGTPDLPTPNPSPSLNFTPKRMPGKHWQMSPRSLPISTACSLWPKVNAGEAFGCVRFLLTKRMVALGVAWGGGSRSHLATRSRGCQS